MTEFSVSGSTSTWKHSNVYAGKLLGTYDTKGLHFYLDDWLGTRRIQTNALGQLELTCQSLPYGNGENCIATALSTAEDPTEQHFTGKERDAESGNDYFEARYYNSAAGRFLSPDWSAKEEPVPYAKLDDPQSINLYAYVKNNSLTGVDPDGHSQCDGYWCNVSGQSDPLAAKFWDASQRSTKIAAFDDENNHGYATQGQAAKAALRRYNLGSIEANKEVAGRIYQAKDAQYRYSPGIVGDSHHSSPMASPIPSDTAEVGLYHTHADYAIKGADGSIIRTSNPHRDDFNSDHFSDWDKDKIRERLFATMDGGYRGYLATPSGRFLMYDPPTDKENPLK